MQPAEAINVVETVLRRAVRQVLGDSWHDGTGVDRAKLQERREEERKRRTGATVEVDLLSYTHLYELHKIIRKRWEDFKPVFGKKERFFVYMERLEDFRNAPMHCRALLPFEQALLEGIAGELRNELTLWRSSQAPDMSWYPTVESITDSLGNLITSGNCRTPSRLQVGDEITFRCIGWDPQDRELTWTLNGMAMHFGPQLDQQVGSEVTLTWHISPAHVAESPIVTISMLSSGEYHREPSGCDFSVTVIYAVDPPGA